MSTRPVEADARLPRLLAGLHADGSPIPLAEHEALHGPLPALPAGPHRGLIAEVERSGLCGRGGAAFPTARKLAAVAARGDRPVVVANGAEGEPASAKDETLLSQAPHLVLDGVAVAAAAVGAQRVVVATKPACFGPVSRAVAQRERAGLDLTPVEVVTTPERFIAGEESALVDYLDGGPGLPRFIPPRVFERGVRGRPTLVQNVETLAHLGLIARHGAGWFRGVGTRAEPGSTLATLGGALAYPGVYEVARGAGLAQLVAEARPTESPQALLIGGYAGTWTPVAHCQEAALSDEALAPLGAVVGAGVIEVLPAGACGLAATADILTYLADQSAGQCGPCVHGLAAIAGTFREVAGGTARNDARRRLENWAWQVTGRGACHHPDGATRLLGSALRTFANDVQTHRQGRCLATGANPRRTRPAVAR